MSLVLSKNNFYKVFEIPFGLIQRHKLARKNLKLRHAWKCQIETFSHLCHWLMFIYPCYSVIHQSEGLRPKVNTYRRTGSQRLAVGIELPNAIVGLVLQSQKWVAGSRDHVHVGDMVINYKTIRTKLRREEKPHLGA